ncbi:hypothetical protein U9M48_035854 [Paspalum notatum var. saurae]|uniref:Uncharacterized protein n=1 Tax=Paspalum notatum var. saurae TaxID=547442 RepID=A0AAQ3UG98_PASNO
MDETRFSSGDLGGSLTVYHIPWLCSNIISLGQLDERGCVLIDNGVLRILDCEQKLVAKVSRSRNRLYVLQLKIARPVPTGKARGGSVVLARGGSATLALTL